MQKVEWPKAQPVRYPLDGAQRQVALASLDTSEVGPVHSEKVSEGFLAQGKSLPMCTLVATNGQLKIAFHRGKLSTAATYRSTDL